MGTDPYGESGGERMTEIEKIIGDGALERHYDEIVYNKPAGQIINVTENPDRMMNAEALRYLKDDIDHVAKAFARPPHWPDLARFDASEFRQEPMKKTVSSTLPFALFINERRFAEGIATISNGELQFHLEGVRELELLIQKGAFEYVEMNVTFNPAYPADQKVTVDPEQEWQSRRLMRAAGIKVDEPDA